MSQKVHEISSAAEDAAGNYLMTGDQIAAHESVIRALPTKVVVDHLGRIPQPDGIRHPGFAAVRRLLDNGRTWVKVTNLRNDKSVVLRINDRMNPRNKRLIDVSAKAARELGFYARGLTRVRREVLKGPPKETGE